MRLLQLQTNDARHHQRNAGQATRRCRLAKRHQPHNDRAHRPNATPHRIGRANGDDLEAKAHQVDAERPKHKHPHRGPQPREPVGKVNGRGKRDFQRTRQGDDKRRDGGVGDGLYGGSLWCGGANDVSHAGVTPRLTICVE